ncbi:amidase domain-containing protein [uncultured Clostridium sp.]|uniref:amidase domain-containing protein n=1 Tax=uncultured Clostridium sp. TaxID=59620 RepID=UPI0025EE027C|nr:amidase domain-containing protein [uncultured Clostridium sp.]
MKKIAIIMMLAVTVVSTVSPQTTVYAYNNISTSKTVLSVDSENVIIKNTLQGYLSNKWEEEKSSQIIENKYILPDSLQMTYSNLKSKLEYKWCQGINETIDWYDMEITINKIQEVGDLIEVDVNSNVTYQYGGADFTSSANEHHLIYLTNNDGEMLVVRDIYNDIFDGEEDILNSNIDFYNQDEFDEYISEKIKKVTLDLKNVDKDIAKYKSNTDNGFQTLLNTQSELLYSSYNGSNAASWAIDHVDDAEEWEGNDCTYFVSMALKQGGLPTDKTWYRNSNAFIRVIELRNWLINKSYATEIVGTAYGNKGDVIQFYNSSKNRWSHSVIVTYVNHQYGNCYVSAHSDAYKNRSVRSYYPTSTYSNARTLKLS